MNELIIDFKGLNWIYFKTNQQTADKAFQEFQETCDNAGINIDNMRCIKARLRDSNQNEIDTLKLN